MKDRIIKTAAVACLLSASYNVLATENLKVLVEGGSPAYLSVMEIKDSFEKKYDAKLDIITAPYSGLQDKLSAEVRSPAGTFDVAAIDVLWFPSTLPALQPLNDVFTADLQADTFSHLIDASTFNGNSYGVPIWDNAEILMYRKDMFEDPKEKEAFKIQYGYELTPPKDLDQLLDVAKFFTRDTNNDGVVDIYGTSLEGFGGHGDAVTNWLALAAYYGAQGHVVNKEGEVILASDPYIKASNKLLELIDEGVVSPNYLELASPQNVDLFKQGRMATMYVWAHFFKGLNDEGSSKVAGDVGTAPAYGAAIPGPWFYVQFAKSKQPKLASQFIQYMYENNSVVADVFGVAARKSVLEEYSQKPEFSHLSALSETLGQSATINRPALKTWNRIEEQVLIPSLQSILLKEDSPENILKDAEKQTKRILRAERRK
ncbi:extracellular solute-binding protein [Vibrio vulnificus]|nr:extracellular solute-binding protein [Vibrio vulnificus]